MRAPTPSTDRVPLLLAFLAAGVVGLVIHASLVFAGSTTDAAGATVDETGRTQRWLGRVPRVRRATGPTTRLEPEAG
jgi:hypothetical protein